MSGFTLRDRGSIIGSNHPPPLSSHSNQPSMRSPGLQCLIRYGGALPGRWRSTLCPRCLAHFHMCWS